MPCRTAVPRPDSRMPRRSLLPLLCALGLAFGVSAQSIENASRSTIGYLGADGRIEDSSRSTVGYIQERGADWTIENASRSTIGYINARAEGEYTIENSSRSTMGYLSRSGDNWRVENSSRSTIGYIGRDGRVENSSRSTLGYARDIPPAWVAVHFFFFRFP